MGVAAQQVFRELDTGKWRLFYLVVGDEPFQMGEIVARVKEQFIKGDAATSFSYEAFDGEGGDAGALLQALQTLPGLFDEPDSTKLVFCSRIDKLSAADFEVLDEYFKAPSETTCFLMTATKIDRRKAWVKASETKGALLEVAEPYERDWPRWRGYLEKKSGKKITEEAWERLVEASGGTLSLVWSEVQKAAVYIGGGETIQAGDVQTLFAGGAGTDVFAFTEDVVSKKRFPALEKYHALLRNGENEIKLLSLLIRHFRQLETCLEATSRGVADPKQLAAQIGVPPFFLSKIQAQAKKHTRGSLARAFQLLSETDFRLKTGGGGLFENFLVPYFAHAMP